MCTNDKYLCRIWGLCSNTSDEGILQEHRNQATGLMYGRAKSQSPWMAITKYHRVGGLNSRTFIFSRF